MRSNNEGSSLSNNDDGNFIRYLRNTSTYSRVSIIRTLIDRKSREFEKNLRSLEEIAVIWKNICILVPSLIRKIFDAQLFLYFEFFVVKCRYFEVEFMYYTPFYYMCLKISWCYTYKPVSYTHLTLPTIYSV